MLRFAKHLGFQGNSTDWDKANGVIEGFPRATFRAVVLVFRLDLGVCRVQLQGEAPVLGLVGIMTSRLSSAGLIPDVTRLFHLTAFWRHLSSERDVLMGRSVLLLSARSMTTWCDAITGGPSSAASETVGMGATWRSSRGCWPMRMAFASATKTCYRRLQIRDDLSRGFKRYKQSTNQTNYTVFRDFMGLSMVLHHCPLLFSKKQVELAELEMATGRPYFSRMVNKQVWGSVSLNRRRAMSEWGS